MPPKIPLHIPSEFEPAFYPSDLIEAYKANPQQFCEVTKSTLNEVGYAAEVGAGIAAASGNTQAAAIIGATGLAAWYTNDHIECQPSGFSITCNLI